MTKTTPIELARDTDTLLPKGERMPQTPEQFAIMADKYEAAFLRQAEENSRLRAKLNKVEQKYLKAGQRDKDGSVFLLLHAKYNISKQEYKVLKGMYELKSRQEIADSIGIERNTVNAHALTLFKKLGVNTSVAACAVYESISDQ